ncbi:MAG: hypothetical protein IKG27_03510 [Bacilli bacterium]|nr:hypothetical protein [Bacilli bacterium]
MKELYIDFDGVILDSQERFKKIMLDNTNLEDWINYLASIEWYNFLRECREIDESLTTIQKLQKYRNLKGIITRIHTFNEGIEKANFLRENNIDLPIFYVLPEQSKSSVVVPNKNRILVDDDIKNCFDWETNGGKAFLLDPYIEHETKKIIKSLKTLL